MRKTNKEATSLNEKKAGRLPCDETKLNRTRTAHCKTKKETVPYRGCWQYNTTPYCNRKHCIPSLNEHWIETYLIATVTKAPYSCNKNSSPKRDVRVTELKSFFTFYSNMDECAPMPPAFLGAITAFVCFCVGWMGLERYTNRRGTGKANLAHNIR